MKTLIILILLLVVAACSAQRQQPQGKYTERFERQWAQRCGAAQTSCDVQRFTGRPPPRPVALGMNREQVKASRGNPRDINRTVGSWGVHEQWVYASSYLYFENGVLASFQD